MVKTKTNRKSKNIQVEEADSVYFLKIVLYMVLGSLWIKFNQPVYLGDVVVSGLPLGLMIGMVFASHDRFQIDRKIAYAILLVMTVLTYFLPAGIVI